MGKVRAYLKVRVIGAGGSVIRNFRVLGRNVAELGGVVEYEPRPVAEAAGEAPAIRGGRSRGRSP